GDDDDGDSSGDDADDEDEEEEEEHLAPVDYAIVIPTDELVSLPEGIEPVIPSPLTDTATIGARITVRLQADISFPPEAEVERLLSMPTPSPSPLASLSPPSAGKQVGYGIRDTWVDPTETVLEIAPMTVGEVNTRVTELVDLHKHDTQDLYALLEDAQDSRTRISQRVIVDSQRMQQTEIADLQETDRRRQAQMVENLRVMGDMRREMGDMQAELLALRTEGVVGLTRWIEKMESVFQISGCAVENQVKFATFTQLDAALTWWNSQIRPLGPDAYSMTWELSSATYAVLTTRLACRPSLVSCLPLLGESLPSVPDAYDQSLEDLLSQSAASESESHVTGVVSE
nr:reverse transcriptase domain-containing protein [Tanacetum cinerariifolium]